MPKIYTQWQVLWNSISVSFLNPFSQHNSTLISFRLPNCKSIRHCQQPCKIGIINLNCKRLQICCKTNIVYIYTGITVLVFAQLNNHFCVISGHKIKDCNSYGQQLGNYLNKTTIILGEYFTLQKWSSFRISFISTDIHYRVHECL